MMLFVAIGFTACTNTDEPLNADSGLLSQNLTSNGASIAINPYLVDPLGTFATVLSKVVANEQEVREFLKNEISQRPNRTTTVSVSSIMDKDVNGYTFRDALISYSSESTIQAIQRQLPWLNIVIPEFRAFDVTVDNMDCTDNEIPVAMETKNGMKLYLNGNSEIEIPNGELPAFHTIVVNTMPILQQLSSNVARIASGAINPGNMESVLLEPLQLDSTAGVVFPAEKIGAKAVTALSYFNHYERGRTNRALQRDYIYYGMKPNSLRGQYDNSVDEYLTSIEINPKAYFEIADTDDPNIKNWTVSRKGSDFTAEELIKAFWSDGIFNFRFEISSSKSTQPIIVFVLLYPDEIWNFNLDRTFRHKTWFRRDKYTYSIDPRKFTSKCVDLTKLNLKIGKWNLADEALERFVTVYEADKDVTREITHTYDSKKMKSTKVSSAIKYNLGTGYIDGTVSAEIGGSYTESKTFTVKTTISDKDDLLGVVKTYFYDPVILGKNGSNYVVNTYSTGFVKFSIIAK